MNNIVLVDKPKGITSFKAVGLIKKKYGAKKAGHAGTLDPMATGLLIVGLNEGTKKLKEYVGLDKTYEAEILLGQSFDTGDIEGELLEEGDATHLTEEGITKAVISLVGKNILEVPKYSSMKQGGESLHKKVRRGEGIIIPKREMVVHNAVVIGIKQEEGKTFVEATFYVESGVYIRSLAEEIGKRLRVPASLSNLRRTRVGGFSVSDAEQIDSSCLS